MKLQKSILMATIGLSIALTSITGSEPDGGLKKVIVEKKAELEPVSKLKNDLTPAEAASHRSNYRSVDWVVNGNEGTYSFLNIPEFYQTATVYRSGGQVAMLEKEIDETIWDTMTETMAGKMPLSELVKHPEARIQGLMVIHDGKIVLEDYSGMRELDKHSWFSASKVIVGLMVHKLEDEGLIDLEKSINYYLPEFDSDDWKKVKVKHLLHHVSGMDYVETNENFADPAHPLAQAVSFSLSTRHEDAGLSVFDLMKGVKSYIEPGVQFDYSTMNTQILGFVVERITNKKFEDFFSETVWTKAGMESDGLYALSAHGEPITGGYFGSRLRDMGRFGMIFTDNWNLVSDEQLVSDSYYTNVYDNTLKPAYMEGLQGPSLAKHFGTTPSHATYQWDAVFEDGDLFKPGRYGQGMYVSPETNTVVVWFSSSFMNQMYVPGFSRQIVEQNFR